MQTHERTRSSTGGPRVAVAGQRYVRSFLFARRIDAPFARVHLLARVLFVFALSLLQLRAIDTLHPDLLTATLTWGVACALLFVIGISRRVAQFYFLVTLPALLSLFTSWLLFNPVAGRVVLLRATVYSGQLVLGVGLWQVLWLVLVGAFFVWARKLALGLLVATVLTIVLTHFVALPFWTWTRVAFFHPLLVLVSDEGLLVACTKVIGYAGMVLATLVLLVTSRDVELLGLLRQLRLPQPIVFFVATVFRSLDLALSDFETIRQAQRARAIDVRPRSFVRRVRDLASLAVPLVAAMIRRSSEIGDALYARGYSLKQVGTDFYETSPWRPIDWVFTAVSLAILYYVFWHYVNLTVLVVG